MTAKVGIEGTKSSDCAPAPGEIEVVNVRKGDRGGTKVNSGGGKWGEALIKVATEGGMGVGEGI
jgi:hypothetical protein